MNSRNLIMGLGLGSAVALMGGLSEATQDTPEADKEADEALAREMEAQRQQEQEQRRECETLVLERREPPAEHNIHYQPEPRRRSKRAQRVKERGW